MAGYLLKCLRDSSDSNFKNPSQTNASFPLHLDYDVTYVLSCLEHLGKAGKEAFKIDK